MKARPELRFIVSGAIIIDDQNHQKRTIEFDRKRNCNLESLYHSNTIVSPSMTMIRKRALLDVGEFDESLVQSSDYDMWLRLAKEFSFDYIPETLVFYREHPESLSQNLGRRYLMHKLIFNKPKLRDGRPWLKRQARIARSYHLAADKFYRQGEYFSAAVKFSESLWLCPWVGMYIWPKKARHIRLSLFYRLIKVYLICVWSFLCAAVVRKKS